MNRLLLIIFFAISFNISFGQIVIQGRILNKETQEPISYANIGISNSNVGTLSAPLAAVAHRITEQIAIVE